jgi:hypothetical protein
MAVMLNPETGEGSDRSHWVRRRLLRWYVALAFVGGMLLAFVGGMLLGVLGAAVTVFWLAPF